MAISLKGRSLLTLMDYTKEEIEYLLDLAKELKIKKHSKIQGDLLKGKNIVLLFEKTSTRTRCAFEVAAYDEGANVTFLTNSQMGKKESLEDTANVLGRFYDGIEFRGFAQKTVEDLAKYSGIPVWNGLTDFDHPTQALADVLTIKENIKKPYNEIKV
ncbi:MAG: ornithine carbamoyltransferase, partial [Eubacteriaceae bacterium]|nr:ornithine carbamoyltransferase [Eubacteriaceae bacterium]